MSGVIVLGKKPKEEKKPSGLWNWLASRISPRGIDIIKPKEAEKVLTSPKTTVGLATTLATLKGGPIAGAKTGLITGTALGILETSKKAQEFVYGKVTDPTAGGRWIGKEIEEFGKEKENSITTKEKLKEGLKKAGLIGGGIALAGAGALAVKKVLEKRKEKKVTEKYLAQTPFIEPQPVGLGGVPLAQPVAVSGYGAPDGTKTPSPIQNIIQIQLA